MSVTYGFYNSQNGDRVYNATQFNDLFTGLITDGVFSTWGNQFRVFPGTSLGRVCIVDTGRAWLDNTWTINDTLYTFDSIPIVSNITGRSRIDMICIEVNKDNRENVLRYVVGEESASPSRPTPESYQYPIAYIQLYGTDSSYVRAENITYVVGQSRENGGTPFVTGLLQQMTVDQLLTQWDAAFGVWFEEIKGQLTEDAATHLQKEIDDLIQYGTEPLTSDSVLQAGEIYFQYEE